MNLLALSSRLASTVAQKTGMTASPRLISSLIVGDEISLLDTTTSSSRKKRRQEKEDRRCHYMTITKCSSFDSSCVDDPYQKKASTQLSLPQHQRRHHYHATPRKEIIPLVAGVAIGVVGYVAYKVITGEKITPASALKAQEAYRKLEEERRSSMKRHSNQEPSAAADAADSSSNSNNNKTTVAPSDEGPAESRADK